MRSLCEIAISALSVKIDQGPVTRKPSNTYDVIATCRVVKGVMLVFINLIKVCKLPLFELLWYNLDLILVAL